ncbi:MAG: hypothetical protein ACI8XZ_003031 [Gammaproteobacteria bacterium]|jgi:hypothetical protein
MIQITIRRRTLLSRAKWWFLVLKYSSLGSITGLVIGVLGPLVFIPEANHGPLHGLFVLRPGGVLMGAALGSFIASDERRPP